MADAYGRAIRDFHRGRLAEPLIDRDGERVREHPIEAFYFDPFDPESPAGEWLRPHLEGPLVDLGAGAGRHALHFQESFDVVALEVSEHLVETMDDRGVADARRGDMFALRDRFDASEFRSALAVGTQASLAGSMQGLRTFLADLAHVTTPDATAVLDSYDPDADGVADLLGHREDPTPGLAHRVLWYEYGDAVDDVLHFRLFGPDRLREVARATGWTVVDTQRPHEPPYYRAALEKR